MKTRQGATRKKLPTWQYRSLGGFYWAGAYVADNYVLIPTDDGDSGYTSGYASILSLNPRTGEAHQLDPASASGRRAQQRDLR